MIKNSNETNKKSIQTALTTEKIIYILDRF